MRNILFATLIFCLPACGASASPSDMEWFSCKASGIHILNGVETEEAPEIQHYPPAIYAASVSAKMLWRYDGDARSLHAFIETTVTGDVIDGRQSLDRPPHWTMTGDITIDRKTLAFTCGGTAIYPDGDRQITRGRGTCTRIAPMPLD